MDILRHPMVQILLKQIKYFHTNFNSAISTWVNMYKALAQGLEYKGHVIFCSQRILFLLLLLLKLLNHVDTKVGY